MMKILLDDDLHLKMRGHDQIKSTPSSNERATCDEDTANVNDAAADDDEDDDDDDDDDDDENAVKKGLQDTLECTVCIAQRYQSGIN